MSEQKEWQIQAEHSGCLIRLQNLIQRSTGFRLLILQQNRPSYRDGLIAFLGSDNSRVLDLHALGNFDAFEAELEQQEQGRMLHLINLESLGEEKKQSFFKGLNYHREHIARTCPGILAFWLPEMLVREMALQAADFWAWREQVLDFTVPLEPVERIYTSLVDTANLDISAKHKRIREIREFLARSSGQPSLTNADLKEELGILFESIGEYAQAENMLNSAIAEYDDLDDAESCAKTRYVLANLLKAQGDYDQAMNLLEKQIMPVFKRLKKEGEQALILGEIADILQERGKFDEALKIRKYKELPVYKRLKLERPKALALGKIADILVARGEYNKALRIWRQECLPVFEHLEDIREKAVTMGRIADVLQGRGQLDKALKIRQKEELRIYERLGDIREQAITKQKIAAILWNSGQTDEVLKIIEQEVLPVFEHLGDIQNLVSGRVHLATLLHQLNAITNRIEIEKLLRLALADAKRLKLPNETEAIENIMKKFRIKTQ